MCLASFGKWACCSLAPLSPVRGHFLATAYRSSFFIFNGFLPPFSLPFSILLIWSLFCLFVLVFHGWLVASFAVISSPKYVKPWTIPYYKNMTQRQRILKALTTLFPPSFPFLPLCLSAVCFPVCICYTFAYKPANVCVCLCMSQVCCCCKVKFPLFSWPSTCLLCKRWAVETLWCAQTRYGESEGVCKTRLHM